MASQFTIESIGTHPPRFGYANAHGYLDQFHGGGTHQIEAQSFREAQSKAASVAKTNASVYHAVERRIEEHSAARPVVRWQAFSYSLFSGRTEHSEVKEARNA